MAFSREKKQTALIYFLLAAISIAAFWQVGRCDFLNYDDDEYVTRNAHIRDGLTMNTIRWAFTSGYGANWHPLTWISHIIDVQLFGLDPHWSHLVNLLIHTVNTLLLFMIFHRMTAAPLKSAFVAALFAVHSLHVESVAWVAERKDVLSTLFWMLSTAAYIRYVRRSGFINYLAVLALYFLGLMAKPMLVTLPFVFLLLDYWPLRRFNVHFSTRSGQMEEERSSNLKPKVSPALDMSSGNPGNVLDGSPKISVFAQLLPLLVADRDPAAPSEEVHRQLRRRKLRAL